ncbi:MAG: pentapeptide repeat-containing protein [Myxococcota bacterium]
MRKLAPVLLVTGGLLLWGSAARAATIASAYLVDAKSFAGNVKAGDTLTYQLSTSPTCDSVAQEIPVVVGTPAFVVEKLAQQKLKGQSHAPSAVFRLIVPLAGVNLVGPLFLHVAGTGVNGEPSGCQAMPSGPTGPQGPLGPPGPQGDAGPPGGPSPDLTALGLLSALHSCAGCYLPSEDFSGLKIAGAYFMGATLNDSNFSNAMLSSAQFDGDLQRAAFTNASMPGATISGNASSADFSGATLSGAVLSGTFDDANFANATLTGASFSSSSVLDANFAHAILNNATFTTSVFSGSNFSFASLRNSSGLVDVCIPSHACTFPHADLTGATVVVNVQATTAAAGKADFSDAVIGGAKFTLVVDGGSPPPGTGDLSRANLVASTADIEGPNVLLSGADLASATLSPFVILNGSVLDGAQLNGANLRNCTITLRSSVPVTAAPTWTNANLAGAHLDNCLLTGTLGTPQNAASATWTGATCPDGNHASGTTPSCVGHFLDAPTP